MGYDSSKFYLWNKAIIIPAVVHAGLTQVTRASKIWMQVVSSKIECSIGFD